MNGGNVEITPAPTEEEAAAIVAAYEGVWPKPVLLAGGESGANDAQRWRFSGRWWSKPVAVRRDRPVQYR